MRRKFAHSRRAQAEFRVNSEKVENDRNETNSEPDPNRVNMQVENRMQASQNKKSRKKTNGNNMQILNTERLNARAAAAAQPEDGGARSGLWPGGRHLRLSYQRLGEGGLPIARTQTQTRTHSVKCFPTEKRTTRGEGLVLITKSHTPRKTHRIQLDRNRALAPRLGGEVSADTANKPRSIDCLTFFLFGLFCKKFCSNQNRPCCDSKPFPEYFKRN